MELGRVMFGGAVAAVATLTLERIDRRLAWWFVALTLLSMLIANRDAFVGQAVLFSGFLRSLK